MTWQWKSTFRSTRMCKNKLNVHFHYHVPFICWFPTCGACQSCNSFGSSSPFFFLNKRLCPLRSVRFVCHFPFNKDTFWLVWKILLLLVNPCGSRGVATFMWFVRSERTEALVEEKEMEKKDLRNYLPHQIINGEGKMFLSQANEDIETY